jgi:hypothetical protein
MASCADLCVFENGYYDAALASAVRSALDIGQLC